MLLTGRVNFGLIQLCLRMVPSYLRDIRPIPESQPSPGADFHFTTIHNLNY
jgi:hypothetical protein